MKTIACKRKNRAAKNIYGFRKSSVEFMIMLQIAWLILKKVKSPVKVIKTIRRILTVRKGMLGNRKLTKLIKAGRKYYWDMHSPGWPSKAFRNFYSDEIDRNIGGKENYQPAKLVVFSITNKCPLRCEHCFEAKSLGKKDHLSLSQIKEVLTRLKRNGLTKVGISGGEPMTRLDDIVDFVGEFSKEVDFWVLTSGYNVNYENALRLKKSGVKGLSISADHFIMEEHNLFRKSPHAFEWMQEAVENAKSVGLLVCLTICATNKFVSRANMLKYSQMAMSLGASFIQIVEPRSVGAYENKNVELTQDKIEILEDFFVDVNYDRDYREFPLIAYNAYHQRRLGCMGNANRYFFIDSEANIHPCHFCRDNIGNLLADNYEKLIQKLKAFKGCKGFQMAAHEFSNQKQISHEKFEISA